MARKKRRNKKQDKKIKIIHKGRKKNETKEKEQINVDKDDFLEEFVKRGDNRFNLTGVVAVGGKKLEYNFPWHDSLMPLQPDMTAIERSVFECAFIGCKMIYIVCHADMQVLIKSRIGESIEDPVWYDKSKRSMTDLHRVRIPIFYVPIHIKDQDRRDCLGWSAIYGCFMSYYIASLVSKYVIPEKYFISFPYGVYDYTLVREYRDVIKKNDNKRMILKYNGKSLFDGMYLSAVLTAQDIIQARRSLRKAEIRTVNPNQKEGSNSLYGAGKIITAPSKMFTGRHFDLEDCFGCISEGNDDYVIDVEEYYNIDCWKGYKQYVSSNMTFDIHRAFPASLHRQRKMVKEYPEIDINKEFTMPQAARRLVKEMYDSGMSEQKISQQTNIPFDKIDNAIDIEYETETAQKRKDRREYKRKREKKMEMKNGRRKR